MWQRYELKDKAKDTLKIYYWKAVLVSFIFSIVTGGVNYSFTYSQNDNFSSSHANNYISNSIHPALFVFSIIFMSIFLLSFLVGIAVNVFLICPLEVGVKRFFVFGKTDNDLGNIIFAFKNSYLNIVKTLFLRGLFTFLWSLLLFIPGIIKSYEYRMIPYILGENSSLDQREAFTLSKQMMDGEKWNTFVLDLSFLGWMILTAATCGILGFFYVTPYMNLTNAELYHVLKNKR